MTFFLKIENASAFLKAEYIHTVLGLSQNVFKKLLVYVSRVLCPVKYLSIK